MGMNSELGIGYEIDIKSCENFRKDIPEQSHVEMRFNSKTGEKYERKIVDGRKRSVFEFDGHQYGIKFDMMDAIASKYNYKFISFYIEDSDYEGQFMTLPNIEDSVSFDSLFVYQKQLEDMRYVLDKIGIVTIGVASIKIIKRY